MATRFYMPAEGSGTPPISPAYDAGWEQTGEASRLKLLRKTTLSSLSTLAETSIRTVPITTTQDILCNQYVSDSIPPQRIVGTLAWVGRVVVSVTTVNVALCIVLKVVSQDGTVVRATLFSSFLSGTNWAATSQTRVTSVQNLLATTTQPGDRLVMELGGHAAAPTTSGTYTMRTGTSATSDFANTQGLTTDLNPWLEVSPNLWSSDVNNYQVPKVGDGMSITDVGWH